MGQRAGGDIIDADIPQLCNLFCSNVAGAFRLRPACDQSHGFLHRLRIHVVKHDDVCPGLHRFAYLLQRFGFYLDLAHKGRVGAGARYGGV